MKLQFILSDEERNRIRSMRESAMKKKQEEILNNKLRNAGRLEVSDVLTATSSQDFQRSGFKACSDDTSVKAAESGDGLKEKSFQNPTFPNVTDRREETPSSPIPQNPSGEETKTVSLSTDMVKNKSPDSNTSSYPAKELDKQNLEEKIQSDFKGTSLASGSTPLLLETEVNSPKNNEIQLQDDVPERSREGVNQKPSVEDTKTRFSSTDLVKNKSPDSNTSNDPAKELYKPKETSLENLSTSLLQETEGNSTKNNEIKLQQTNVLERSREGLREEALVQDTKTRELTEFMKENEAAESKPDNLLRKLDKQNLEEKVHSFVPKTSEKSNSSEVQLQQSDDPERLQDVGSSRSIIAEKIKSFSPKFAGEPDKQGPPEKTARNIRKMISVFESSISQDRVPFKPPGMKSYRIGSSRLLKDNAVKDCSEESESSSKRLRKSFSANDLRENVLGIGKTEENIGFDNDFVEPNETNRIVSADPKETEKIALTETNTIELPKSPEEVATVSGRTCEEDEESNSKRTENISDDHDGATSLLGDPLNEEKSQSHQEKAVSYVPESIVEDKVHCGTDGIVKQDKEMVCVSGNSSPKGSDEEASTVSIGQVVKIALVVGFGVLVLLFRQREHGKSKKKENGPAFKTRVFMKKRGSIEEQLRRIDVLKL